MRAYVGLCVCVCVSMSVSRGPLWRPHPFNLAPEGSLHLGRAQRPQAGAPEVLPHHPRLLLGFVIWAGVWPRWGRESESHLGPAWCRPYSCFFQRTLDLDSRPGAGRNLGQAPPGPSYRPPPPTPCSPARPLCRRLWDQQPDSQTRARRGARSGRGGKPGEKARVRTWPGSPSPALLKQAMIQGPFRLREFVINGVPK